MTIAYVDMVGGAAGDMLLAAFLDAGLDRADLERALRTIVPEGWTLTPQRVTKRGIAATYAGLVVPGEDGSPEHRHHHQHQHEDRHDHRHDDRHEARHARGGHERRLADVLALLDRSGLSDRQRERAAAIYRRLAEAEARVHGTSVEEIHFHEIGQVDAILDVAGSCVALDLLGIDELRCSPFPVGHGSIGMEHGRYPNPPPATAELLRGFPLRWIDVEGELVTTTAAAILTTLATPGPLPELVVERIGYGAGRSDFSIPNVTRVLIGTAAVAPREADEVCVLEANIDDMSPQHYELALERLFAAGARDVWLAPVTMKKGRPAIVLSALGAPGDADVLARTILRETTTIGVRVRNERRYVAPREIALVNTAFGTVRVKRAIVDGHARHRAEYDDLVRIARERGLPLGEVVRVVDLALAEPVEREHV